MPLWLPTLEAMDAESELSWQQAPVFTTDPQPPPQQLEDDVVTAEDDDDCL
jgi:hypothetical protein